MILNKTEIEHLGQQAAHIEGRLADLSEEERKSIDGRFLKCSLALIELAIHLAAHEDDARAAMLTAERLRALADDLTMIYIDTEFKGEKANV